MQITRGGCITPFVYSYWSHECSGFWSPTLSIAEWVFRICGHCVRICSDVTSPLLITRKQAFSLVLKVETNLELPSPFTRTTVTLDKAKRLGIPDEEEGDSADDSRQFIINDTKLVLPSSSACPKARFEVRPKNRSSETCCQTDHFESLSKGKSSFEGKNDKYPTPKK
jgi:hypothetical protein